MTTQHLFRLRDGLPGSGFKAAVFNSPCSASNLSGKAAELAADGVAKRSDGYNCDNRNQSYEQSVFNQRGSALELCISNVFHLYPT